MSLDRLLRTLVCTSAVVVMLPVYGRCYIRLASDSNSGSPLFRQDNTQIRFLVNTTIAPGYTNSDGAVMITPVSDPMLALAAAEAAWANIQAAAVGFAPLLVTTLQNDPSDGNNVMTIVDTPENRSIVGDYLAITVYQYSADNSITDSDIIFNPAILDGNGNYIPFSTDEETNSYDLRSVATHEIGHALGANHSGVSGATMNFSTSPIGAFADVADATVQRTLSTDDVAFVTDVYPKPGYTAEAGAIGGTVSFSNGAPVLGGLVVAIDQSSGAMIGGISSLVDGSYRIAPVHPGNYTVYAQPLNGPVDSSDLGISADLVTGSFRTTFAGGNLSPSTVPVADARTSLANITVDTAPSDLQIADLGVGSVGGTDWSYADVKTAISGRSIDILLWGTGLGDGITESQLRVLGPGVRIEPGTLRTQPSAEVNGLIPVRFTLDISPTREHTPISVGIVSGTDAAIRSGGLVLLPAMAPRTP